MTLVPYTLANARSFGVTENSQPLQVQLDELYAVLSAVKDSTVSEAEALKRLSRSPHWV